MLHKRIVYHLFVPLLLLSLLCSCSTNEREYAQSEALNNTIIIAAEYDKKCKAPTEGIDFSLFLGFYYSPHTFRVSGYELTVIANGFSIEYNEQTAGDVLVYSFTDWKEGEHDYERYINGEYTDREPPLSEIDPAPELKPFTSVRLKTTEDTPQSGHIVFSFRRPRVSATYGGITATVYVYYATDGDTIAFSYENARAAKRAL